MASTFHNTAKAPPSRCPKCNILFSSVEQLSAHIKHSRKHFCCQKCEAIVEFKNFLDLCTHYKTHHCQKCTLDFTTAEEGKTHRTTSPRHFCCRCCDGVVEFQNIYNLRLHYRQQHCTRYCGVCEEVFADADACRAHMLAMHAMCSSCHSYWNDRELFELHRLRCKKGDVPQSSGDRPNGKQDPPKAQNPVTQSHYATLGISPRSTQEEVIKAAKAMRVMTHPDRLKRREGLTAEQGKAIDKEAARVGEAADVLSDPLARALYDLKMW